MFTIEQIEQAVTTLNERDVEAFVYEPFTRYGRGSQKEAAATTVEGRLVWDLVEEYGQRLNGVSHHLSYAKAWTKNRSRAEGIQIAVNQAWISLIQAQVLAAQIEVSAAVAGLTRN
jgi:hypothetical protein